MKSITINIKNDKLAGKVIGLLEFLKNEEVEIVSKEDMDDLNRIKETRGEESVTLDEYLKDEKKAS